MRNLKAAFALLVVAMAATSVARAEPVLIPNSYVVPVADWEPFIVAKKQLANHVILSPPLATGTRASFAPKPGLTYKRSRTVENP